MGSHRMPLRMTLRFPDQWDAIAPSLRSILADPFGRPPRDLMSLHNTVYKVIKGPCAEVPEPTGTTQTSSAAAAASRSGSDTAKCALALHDELRKELHLYLRTANESLNRRFGKGTGTAATPAAGAGADGTTGSAAEYLAAYCDLWGRFDLSLKMLKAVFGYAQSNWASLPGVEGCAQRIGLRAWREVLFPDDTARLDRALLDVYATARHELSTSGLAGASSLPEALKKALDNAKTALRSLRQLTLNPKQPLHASFEREFLVTSKFHFAHLNAVLPRGDPTALLATVAVHCTAELTRAREVLSEPSEKALKDLFVLELVTGNLEVLFGHLDVWLDNAGEAQASLEHVFKLCLLKEAALRDFCARLTAYIDATGKRTLMVASGRNAPGAASPPASAASKETELEDATIFATTAAELIQRYTDMARDIFQRHVDVRKAVSKGVVSFLNANCMCLNGVSTRVAELLAVYANAFLRKFTSEEDEDFVEAVGHVGLVLRSLNDRDVFQQRYTAFLAHRLIYGFHTLALEERVVDAVREATAFEFTYKWGRMLHDVDIATAEGEKFNDFMFAEANGSKRAREEDTDTVDDTSSPALGGAENASGTVGGSDSAAGFGQLAVLQFTPLVLRQGAWPLVRSVTAAPVPIVAVCQQYEGFFKKAHPSKRLVWLNSVSHGVLRPLYAARHEFAVTLPQAAILLAFASGPDHMTVRDLAAATGLVITPGSSSSAPHGAATAPQDPNEAVAVVIRLLAKAKVVTLAAEAGAAPPASTAEGAVDTARPGTIVTLNTAFTSGSRKVNLLGAALSRQSGAKKAAGPGQAGLGMEAERQLAIQASVMKVMKSRRRMRRAELSAEVIEVLQRKVFTPSMGGVQQSVASLIDKEYLQVDDDDGDFIVFVA